ncbi:predicted protein [Microbacterium esteraromaticum]|uniref:Hsp70 family protein n=1 Tax=Microbacterium esteraromaticum TaxID=57043 RepID=A0A1R4J5H0_9MICO|nr:Hsp70 family protein [Microbacterium esteraromaticum]SJN27340.1 predicted protein [Microbacterium esteraromaticum]
MGESEFVLALDAGTTSVASVIACSAAGNNVNVARFALEGERAAITALAFITENGDACFGEEAERLGREHPEHLVRDFMPTIGDHVPIVVGGFAISAEELFARMVLWIVSAAAIERGSRPGIVAIAHPTGWCGYRADAVRAHLHRMGLHDVLLVPSAVVVAQHHASSSSRSHTVGVYDLGGRSFEASVLRGAAPLGTPVRAELGGSDVDAALMRHVLALSAPPLAALESGAAAGSPTIDRAELVDARRAVVAAKEALSVSADTSVQFSLGGRASSVRLTRSELDMLASAVVTASVDTMERALDAAQVDAIDLDEIILVGGAARIPLVVQSLSDRLDRPITVPTDPQFAVALGAAEIAWAQLQKRHPTSLVPALEPTEALARQRHAKLVPIRAEAKSSARSRIPYGAAAVLAAGAVIVAAGLVFASSTPLGTGAGADEGASSEGDSSNSESMRLLRSASGYSVATAALTPAAVKSTEAAADRVFEADMKAEMRPRTPQPPSRSTAPKPRRSGIGAGRSIAPADSTGDPAPAPRPASTPAPASGSATTSPPASTPTPSPSGTTAPPDPAPSPTPDPTTEPTPDPTPDPAPAPAPDPAPVPDPAPEPSPAPSAGPTVAPSDPEPSPSATDPPAAEPTP